LDDLAARGFSPMHFRYFCANAHYRSKLNFTWEGLAAAKTSYERLISAVHLHKDGSDTFDVSQYVSQMRESVLDDLNIPKALGYLQKLVKQGHIRSQAIYDAVLDIDHVLGLQLDNAPEAKPEAEIPSDILALVEQRQAAKAAKNYAEADRLRNEMKAMGYELMDSRDGVQCRKI
jgi:cysteinyl-tRNA synthetase